MIRLALPPLRLLLVGLPLLAAVALGQDRLVLLDGTTVEGEIASIDAAGKIEGEGLTGDLEVDGLSRIETLVDVNPAEAAITAELLGGGSTEPQAQAWI